MTTISRNPITGDLESKADYFTTIKLPRKKVSIESVVYPVMLQISKQINVGTIEAFEIMSDNLSFLTQLVEVDNITDPIIVVKTLIKDKF